MPRTRLGRDPKAVRLKDFDGDRYEPSEIISHHLGRLTEKPKKGGTLKDQETTAEYSRLDLNLLDQSPSRSTRGRASWAVSKIGKTKN